MKAVQKSLCLLLVWLVSAAVGPAMAANVFVGDTGGGTVLDPAAIHEFQSTTGDQSQLVSGDRIWPIRSTWRPIVRRAMSSCWTWEQGQRRIRRDYCASTGNRVCARKSPWAKICGFIRSPSRSTATATSRCSTAGAGEPALLRFDGQTGERSVIAAGQNLWNDPIDLVADPTTGDIFVLDVGGAVAFDPPAIRRFNGLTGAASIVAEGADLWYDATRITADANGDPIVLDLGGAAVAALPRLLRFDCRTGDRTEIVSGDDLWYNPIDLDVNLPTGEVVVLDRGGGAAFLLPTLRSFDGVTGEASIIAEGTDLWVNSFAVAVVPEPWAGALCLIAGVIAVMIGHRPTTRPQRPTSHS